MVGSLRTGPAHVSPPRILRYESDGELISEVSHYVLEGLAVGEPSIVIATGGHRHALAENLARGGLDVDRESRSGRLTLLDAEDMHRLFVAGGTPDLRLFESTLGTMIERSAAMTGAPVRVYSELADARPEVAQRLDEMWSSALERHPFKLLAPDRVQNERSDVEQELRETIRALRQSEQAERARADELAETVRITELFTSVLAHDLRNPLGAIMTAAQLLQMKAGDANDPGARAAARIAGSGQRMVRMIDQLLDFTQIRAGLTIDPQPGDLVAIVGAVVDEQIHSYPDQPIRYTHAGDARGNFDADRLGQAFSNVLGNAAQHGVAGTGVDIHLDATGPSIVVTIHNAGAIPDAVLPNLFAPMTAGVPRKRDGSRGLGLGLFITQQIVQTHGGEVAVASNPTDGTTFTITLPRDAQRATTRPRASNDAARHTEQLLRMLVSSVRDYAMFVLDKDGHVRTWNRGAELIKGYAPDEIIGKHISTFYTAKDKARGLPQQLLGQAVVEGRIEDEGWRVRKDGSQFWADVVITALRDQSGELYGFAKVTRDLSEKRIAEERLRRSEERFRMLVDGVKDYAIFLLDPEGNVATWNTGAERIEGYTAKEITGKHFGRFYTPEEIDSGKPMRQLAIAIAEGRCEEEGWRLRKDGARFWANAVITPLYATNGDLVGYAQIIRDLSERHRAEQARLELAKANEAIKLRDEFLSIVSHELKTPLAGLQLQLDSMHVPRDDDRLVNKLDRATASSRRLAQLVDSLLDMSRIATGRFVLHLDEVDLAHLVHEVVESFRPSAMRAGCELVTDLAPVVGRFDRVRLAQVIINILSNALKYGAGKPIGIQLTVQDREVVLAIRDHGPGIAPGDAERIFERFERAAATRHYGGLGIGLYVVREIVLAHDGTVSAASAEGGGARFMVRLPLEPSLPES